MRWGLLFPLLFAATTAAGVELDKRKYWEPGIPTTSGATVLNLEKPRMWTITAGCAAGLARGFYEAKGYGDPEFKGFAHWCLTAVASAFLPKLSLYSVNDSFYVGWHVKF